MKRTIHTDGAPGALGPYSQAVAAGNMLFSCGQIGLDPATGEFVPGGVAEQTRRALLNLAAVLEAAGMSMENVVKTTVFLKSMDDFQTVNGVYAEFFTDDPPARSAVEVARLPKDALVEIEVIASR